jgi:YopX protein
MRERKYRVWSPRMKHMLEWDICKNMMADLLLTESKENIPLEYTGLKDSNGKEIYESDCVSCETNNGTETFYVFWLDELGAWGLMPEQYDVNKGEFLFHYGADAFEIIGNVFENPKVEHES